MMNHRSLANKYRPRNFSELKGQKVLVQTLTNAIKNKKPFQAYLLAGIRGIGKTTSARIIAKTLNCFDLQIDEQNVIPCEKCKSCLAMGEDAHPDIIELDAASKTGVNDVREIIGSSRYVPILGKYKVYIVDEVHMLSNNAFNALLKILEEPPSNVIFIFATTESRKIPMTVISRCQKFNLHRFNVKELTDHLTEIAKKENIKHTMSGLKEIAKYSEGALRDSIAIFETVSMYKENQETAIDEKLVHKVLGISDSNCKYKLFEAMLNGNAKESLGIVSDIYYKGVDLSDSLEEILWVTNTVSKIITVKGYLEELDLLDSEKDTLKQISQKTDLINLTTIWQMIFKGIQQLKNSTNKLQTSEMLMIRLCYLSKLPSIENIISKTHETTKVHETTSATQTLAPIDSNPQNKKYNSFRDIVNLFRKNKEIILYHQLMEEVNLTSFTSSKIEMKISPSLPKDFANQISTNLEQWTKQKWQIAVSKSEISSSKTLRVQETENIKNEDAIVKDILESFPGAKVKTVVGIGNA